ncbi:hypothetical protein PUR61_07745 [Streptomyces sp. BE20]|uniref:hypothetical protein n=1 Tax=Streptomyces sp. BE20 TaxID=3002525 RepID=UPI002E7901AE|nr:hypothetical protein [Streptomyces sp. BE20]MEE1822084.1 hypothetical protein [Streptomyces sp. BE20]
MAGNLVLKDISQSDLNAAERAAATGVSWSKVHHKDIPWDAKSRADLETLLSGKALKDRSGLPPHRYLTFSLADTRTTEARADIERFLLKPDPIPSWMYKGPGGLVLPHGDKLNESYTYGTEKLTAQKSWNNGNLHQALHIQYLSGSLIVEVYYLSGREIK